MVEGEDGDYSPFTERHYQEFQANDTWAHPDRLPNAVRALEARRAAEKKRDSEKHREFREKLLERLDFNHERSIVVPRDIPDA